MYFNQIVGFKYICITGHSIVDVQVHCIDFCLAKLGFLFGRLGGPVVNQVGQSQIVFFTAGRRGVSLAELGTVEFHFGRLNPIPYLCCQ